MRSKANLCARVVHMNSSDSAEIKDGCEIAYGATNNVYSC